MTRMRVRPGAKWAPGAKKTSGKFRGDGPPKALFHATITPSTSLPGYYNQSMAPHETILWNPSTKRMTPVTHYYFDQYAKALQNKAGGVETNNDEVLQWELAGYLGRGTPKGQFDILEAPNVYWEQLADIIGPVVISWKIANKFSRSFGSGITEKNQARRMSFSEWDNFSGILYSCRRTREYPLGQSTRSASTSYPTGQDLANSYPTTSNNPTSNYSYIGGRRATYCASSRR